MTLFFVDMTEMFVDIGDKFVDFNREIVDSALRFGGIFGVVDYWRFFVDIEMLFVGIA